MCQVGQHGQRDQACGNENWPGDGKSTRVKIVVENARAQLREERKQTLVGLHTQKWRSVVTTCDKLSYRCRCAPTSISDFIDFHQRKIWEIFSALLRKVQLLMTSIDVGTDFREVGSLTLEWSRVPIYREVSDICCIHSIASPHISASIIPAPISNILTKFVHFTCATLSGPNTERGALA
jgi:hypothetical protein